MQKKTVKGKKRNNKKNQLQDQKQTGLLRANMRPQVALLLLGLTACALGQQLSWKCTTPVTVATDGSLSVSFSDASVGCQRTMRLPPRGRAIVLDR